MDCLVTGGTATLTAVVTRSDAGPAGERPCFSISEGCAGEPDRLGFSWGVANVDPEKTAERGNVTAPKVGTWMAPAPFAPATRGGFTVPRRSVPAGDRNALTSRGVSCQNPAHVRSISAPSAPR